MHAFNKQRSLVQTIFSFLVFSLFQKKRCIIIKPTFSRFLELLLSRHTHSGGGCHEFHTNHEECEVTQLIFASPFKRLSISSQFKSLPSFQTTKYSLHSWEDWALTKDFANASLKNASVQFVHGEITTTTQWSCALGGSPQKTL